MWQNVDEHLLLLNTSSTNTNYIKLGLFCKHRQTLFYDLGRFTFKFFLQKSTDAFNLPTLYEKTFSTNPYKPNDVFVFRPPKQYQLVSHQQQPNSPVNRGGSQAPISNGVRGRRRRRPVGQRRRLPGDIPSNSMDLSHLNHGLKGTVHHLTNTLS